VQAGEWNQALQQLARANSTELYYHFSPALMAHVPKSTVDAWINSRVPLEPRKLLPALMHYSPAQGPNEPIRFLEHCIRQGNNDSAIHNYLLSLYAQQDDDEALLSFLQRAEAVFDLRYALRLALRHKKKRACVDIYSAMGLHEEAVNLAIQLDINLAKQHANKPPDDELRKKLWLRIAQHVVKEEQDIKKAMAFLKDCELLRIEDILPFFPDFVLIDDFKDEICRSLEDYNRHIEDLKREMDDATQSADLIRGDMKQLRSKCGFVAGNQKCDLCAFPVLSRAFYLFPCQHTFHADCLMREVKHFLTDAQRKRLRQLQAATATAAVTTASLAPPTADSTGAGTLASKGSQSGRASKGSEATQNPLDLLPQTEQLKNELDDLVASQCITCGKVMIDSIVEPFINVRDQELVKSWFI
jgi:tetratricopeptide (TPR) repeat protein